MEVINKDFWRNKRVFITGHTGFKGSWLCLWLTMLGAKVTGYALKPPTNPSLYELCDVDSLVNSVISDIRDQKKLEVALLKAKPEIVIHMAAQPLVRESYKNPKETYSINVNGTINLFEAARKCSGIRVILIITSDKCYENKERLKGYKEDESLGGYDPYSNSKACQELITSAYRNSFFNPKDHKKHKVAVASARAGNVIGGGDFAQDRLVPDFVRSILKGQQILIRSPKAIRPWQHVLEPLGGYMLLCQKLYQNGPKYAGAWNFGPKRKDAKNVEWLIKNLCSKWDKGCSYKIDIRKHPHEAHYLYLDISKAFKQLNWAPKWDIEKALDKVIEWTKAYRNKKELKKICLDQIKEYSKSK